MIGGFLLSFFFPLVVHVLAGLMTGVTGIVAFRAPKRPGRHQRWGTSYMLAYTVVFITATMLSVQSWEADAYLFFLAVIGYGLALCGYGARRFRQEPRIHILGKQWVVVHIVGMIGSYVVLWTAFFVDNAHRIPGLNQLPSLTFWVLPTVIGIPFIVVSISRFVPKRMVPARRPSLERKEGGNDMRKQNQGLPRRKYRMAKPYRVNAFVRINNTMISSLLRLGIKVWSFSLLTVRGRKSGKLIETPLVIFVQDQKRYLVAAYGVVNWVRNLRAAGGEAALTWKRHNEKIHAIELEPEAAAPIFREALRSGPPGIPAVIFRVYRSLLVLPYLNVTENSSLAEFEREALIHPVFLLQPAEEDQSGQRRW